MKMDYLQISQIDVGWFCGLEKNAEIQKCQMEAPVLLSGLLELKFEIHFWTKLAESVLQIINIFPICTTITNRS